MGVRTKLNEIGFNERNSTVSSQDRNYWRVKMEAGRSALNILTGFPTEKKISRKA